LLTIRLHRLNFYVVVRKLIAELQAFSQCIQETPMVRFYSSIYADDESLIRQMSCDSAFHGIPHQIAAAHRTKTECLAQQVLLNLLTNAVDSMASITDRPHVLRVTLSRPDTPPALALRRTDQLANSSLGMVRIATARYWLKFVHAA
jgi:hypothetical protein